MYKFLRLFGRPETDGISYKIVQSAIRFFKLQGAVSCGDNPVGMHSVLMTIGVKDLFGFAVGTGVSKPSGHNPLTHALEKGQAAQQEKTSQAYQLFHWMTSVYCCRKIFIIRSVKPITLT